MSGRGKTPTAGGKPTKPTNTGEFRDDLPTTVDDPAKYNDFVRTVPGKPVKDLKAAPKPTPKPPVLPAAPASPKPAPRMKAISMKTPANPTAKPVEKPEREMPHIQLRAMSEVSRAQIPLNLGNLAPPYDPAEARARTVRDYAVWGSLAVIIASAIALIVWFVAT